MAGRASKRKGSAGEREIAKLLGGQRVPLSGAAGGEFAGDVIVPGLGTGEVKRRRDGFKQIYKWLGDNDFLAIRADRKEWLIVLPLDRLLRLMGRDSDDN
jgi:hypothetical protein